MLKYKACTPFSILFSVTCSVVLLSKKDVHAEIDTQIYRSPNGQYSAGWRDYDEMRVIYLKSRHVEIFNAKTTARYTLIAWNKDSTAVVLVDAPDNANTSFQVAVVSRKLLKHLYSLNIYSSLGIEDKIGDPQNLFRGGVLHINWINEHRIACKIVADNINYMLIIDVRNGLTVRKTIKLGDYPLSASKLL